MGTGGGAEVQFAVEVITGQCAGKVITVAEGQVVTVGRARRADFAIPTDRYLSRVHFALDNRGQDCVLIDQGTVNGTFVNMKRVSKAVVHDGDEIKAGNTLLVVRKARSTDLALSATAIQAGLEPPKAPTDLSPETPAFAKLVTSPPQGPEVSTDSSLDVPVSVEAEAPSPAVKIGGWLFSNIPEGWVVDEGKGVHFTSERAFPCEAVVSEQFLAPGMTLRAHIESEVAVLREFVAEPQIEIAGPIQIRGADEAIVVAVRWRGSDGKLFAQSQVYARSAQLVEVLMLTTWEEELPRMGPQFDAILSGAALHKAGDSVGQDQWLARP